MSALQDFNLLWHQVLPIVFSVILVPEALISLPSSSHTGLGCFLSVLMIIESLQKVESCIEPQTG